MAAEAAFACKRGGRGESTTGMRAVPSAREEEARRCLRLQLTHTQWLGVLTLARPPLASPSLLPRLLSTPAARSSADELDAAMNFRLVMLLRLSLAARVAGVPRAP